MLDLRPATQRTAALLASIADDQLGSPTPCPNYSLGDLLDHLNGLVGAFTDAAAKQSSQEIASPPPLGSAARLEPDWRDRIPERLATLAEAWRDPAAWGGMTRAGGFDMPGEIAGRVALNEVIVHGWDIAKASGQPYGADPDDVQVCIETMAPQPGEERPAGDDVAFGRPVDVADDAPPVDRLVAVLGRDPAWARPATSPTHGTRRTSS